MKNYVQPGNTITLTAPYAVASGDGLLVGAIFGVASGTASEAGRAPADPPPASRSPCGRDRQLGQIGQD